MRKRGYRLLAVAMAAMMLAGCGNAGNEQGKENNTEIVQGTELETESEIESEMETETESETQLPPEPVVQTVTITAAGDCSLGALQMHSYEGSFHDYYDTYGEEYFFKNFREVFENDDLTIVNLEGVLTDATDRVEKTYNIKGRPEYTGIMTSSSVEAVSLGNNHSADYGPQSLTDTKNALDAAGILYAINDIISYYTTDDGMVVAMVSASITGAGNARDQYLLDGVKKAQEAGADLVVALCHWGIERDYYPSDYQRNLGHKLIDAGADLVIGHHPHVLQGVEEYNGKIICYSLGNFSFGGNRNPAEKNTIAYQQTFTFVDGVLQADIDAKIYPSRISGHNDHNDFQPMIAQGDLAASIISKMNAYSEPYSGVFFDEQGKLIIKTTE